MLTVQVYENRFAEALEKLAEDAHQPVLYILLKQNRELSYASVFRGKPAKGSTSFGPGRCTKTVSINKCSLRSEDRFAAVKVNGFVT
jgi:hypothetical protein